VKPGLAKFYAEHGFAGRLGFGERPALIVIDMARAWLDPASPIAADFEELIERIRSVLGAARGSRIPVFYTTMPYPPPPGDLAGVYARKLTHVAALSGEHWSEIDPRLAPSDRETVIQKHRASAFYGTTLLSQLVGYQVDTLLITGCSTSGCVRSTAESSFNVGLHTIVVRDCVGDRSPTAHEANLVDIDSRYADLVDSIKAIAYLESVARGAPLQETW
jgi:nicotinamidase-related amidase